VDGSVESVTANRKRNSGKWNVVRDMRREVGKRLNDKTFPNIIC
jgi:hypothetical protein